MADPRNAVAFEGINGQYATFKIDDSTILYDATKTGGSASVGLAVTLSAPSTVALTADGNAITGKLILVEADKKATVQVGGFMTLPGGVAAGLALGKKIVGALGPANAKGYIREVATAAPAELGVAAGKIVDASNPTAVVVQL